MRKFATGITRALMVLAPLGLFWLLSSIGWEKIVTHFRMVGWEGAFLLLGLGLAEALLDARALQGSALGPIGLARVLFINQFGALLNILGPSETGEVLKATLISRQVPGHGLSATLIWNVAFRLSKSIVILLAAAFAFVLLPSSRHIAALGLLLSALGFLTYLILRIMIHRGWVSLVMAKIGRLPVFASSWATTWAERIVHKTRDAEAKTNAFRKDHPQKAFKIIGYQTAARLLDLATVILALRLLGSGYSPAQCALIYVGIQMVGYLLTLIPTRFGTTEGSAYLLFAYLGLNGALGTILQVVLRIRQLTIIILCIASYSLYLLMKKIFKSNSFFLKATKPRIVEELIDFYFHRRLAVPVVHLADRLGLTPNQVTGLALLSGVLSAFSFYKNFFLVGSLLLLTAVVLDCADGMLARLTGQASPFGRLLDGITDAVWIILIWLGLFLSGRFSYESTELLKLMAPAGLSMFLHTQVYDSMKNNYLALCEPNHSEQNLTAQEIADRLKEGFKNRQWRETFNYSLLWIFSRGPQAKPIVSSERQALARENLSIPMRLCSFLGAGTHLGLLFFCGLLTPHYHDAMLVAFAIILGPLNLLWVIVGILWFQGKKTVLFAP